MLPCAFCDKSCKPTREHVIPRWYNDTPGENNTFSSRAPFTHLQGDLIVKDVCQACNGGVLSALDAYGKELYGRYFASPIYSGDSIEFCYDGNRLLRWLLKLSYNSARAQNADSRVLREFRNVALGTAPFPDRIRCWLHVIAPTFHHPESSAPRPAQCNERGNPHVDEPLWFRIGQFRIISHPSPQLVQRTVIINSFAFTLLIARSDAEWPSAEFGEWSSKFEAVTPEAKQIFPRDGNLALAAGRDHTAMSYLPLYLSYPSRFGDGSGSPVAQLVQSLKGQVGPVALHVPVEMLESDDISDLASTLQMMVSNRENAAAFKQRVTIMVDGFDDDPRDLWQVPNVKQFFRRLFSECPFVMFLAYPEGALLKLLAACWVYEEPFTQEVREKGTSDFLSLAFDGLNALGHTIALSEEQNREICKAASISLFGEAPPD